MSQGLKVLSLKIERGSKTNEEEQQQKEKGSVGSGGGLYACQPRTLDRSIPRLNQGTPILQIF